MKMTEFPIVETRTFMMGKLASFSIHCVCRMPLDADDIFESKECSLCNGMYHDRCVQGISIKNIPGEQRWIFPTCAEECRLSKQYVITNTNAFCSIVE